MAAPTVTRPLASMEQDEKKPSFATEAMPYVKWIVLLSVVIGVGALIAVVAVTMTEKSRTTKARTQFDEIFTALKDKKKPEEIIAALESVADKVKGSTAHAYVLMNLGNLYFQQSIKPELQPEERAAALKKATQLYETLATNEPYRSNQAFGPQAAENLALAYEQANDLDKAITTLGEAADRKDFETHFLHDKLVAELGRLYYVRSLSKPADSAEAQKDRDIARTRLDDALKAIGENPNEERSNRRDGEYIEYLTYIKSLVDKPGKALPDGKAPPLKPLNVPAPVVPPAAEKKDAPPADKKVEDKKADEKKPDAPKEEKKSSLELPTQTQEAGVPAPQHVSFSQIQQMLKDGNTSFCQCPKCAPAQKTTAAKMIE